MGVTVRGAPDGEDYRFASAIGAVGVVQNAGAAQCRSAPGMARDCLLLTSLRSPVMLLGWIFLVYVFGYVAYSTIAHRIDVAADPYATQEPHVFWVVLAILFSVLMVLLAMSLILSFTVVDRDGVHAYRFLMCYWRRHDFSWEDFWRGSFVSEAVSRSNDGVRIKSCTLYVSREWRSWKPDDESAEGSARHTGPRRTLAKGTGIPGLQFFSLSGGGAVERVDRRWCQVIEWAEHKGYLRRGDTRPGTVS